MSSGTGNKILLSFSIFKIPSGAILKALADRMFNTSALRVAVVVMNVGNLYPGCNDLQDPILCESSHQDTLVRN